MVSVVRAGTSLSFPIEPGVNGHPETAHTVSAEITVGGSVTETVSVPFEDAINDGAIRFAASATAITDIRAFAQVVIRFWSEEGDVLFEEVQELVLESDTVLRPGHNSFATYPDLVLESMNRADLSAFSAASKEEKTAALITAYYNIGRLSVSFRGNARNRHPLLPPERLNLVASTVDLTAEDIAVLPNSVQRQLLQAQLIEAEDLLGGNPIERQRLAGLLSHSAGESTHFYRTTKPLELPVNRKTAQALWGIISYAVRIGR